MKNPAFERVSLENHKNKQTKPFQLFIAWYVSDAKGLSVHVCRFGIEGSVRVWPGTSFGQIFKKKLASKIT